MRIWFSRLIKNRFAPDTGQRRKFSQFCYIISAGAIMGFATVLAMPESFPHFTLVLKAGLLFCGIITGSVAHLTAKGT